MDFTRQPIIETVITAKEGFKLVIRNSKAAGVEEYFVDAVEVVSFGGTFFFRSTEKPKPFLLPSTDYEVLEVREARMILKSANLDKAIKIGGGKEVVKQVEEEKKEPQKPEKKREKRKNLRRRRMERGEEGAEQTAYEETSEEEFTPAQAKSLGEHVVEEKLDLGKRLHQLVPPPTTLISETIEKQYRSNELFKDAFYVREEKEQEALTPQEEKLYASSASFEEQEDLPKDKKEEKKEVVNQTISLPPPSIIPSEEITS